MRDERGNVYRTHTCEVLRPDHLGQAVRLAGWVHRKRDHGQLLFIDLRDHYGITQCVVTPGSPAFTTAEGLRSESVISVSGKVVARSEENINPQLPTGLVEVDVQSIDVLSAAETLPFPVAGTQGPRIIASDFLCFRLAHDDGGGTDFHWKTLRHPLTRRGL